MNKLQQAIENGKAEVEKLKKITDKENAAKLEKQKNEHQELVKWWLNKLTENDCIFNLIKEAIINGKKSIVLNHAGWATIETIKNNPDIFAGIHTTYESGTYNPSDDCTANCEQVIITWDEK